MAQFSLTEEWAKLLCPDLPPLWQVLYFEAMHGNHILFYPDTPDSFSGEDLESDSTSGLPEDVNRRLVESGAGLLGAGTLGEMWDIVRKLDRREKAYLFRLYMNWLAELQLRIRNVAH
ncbi:MAG: hypothetical protein H6618_01990 [Deltaproteobacteria bacterium]|nr:hypothetical protein [Deltaproteobacteria bacterium]